VSEHLAGDIRRGEAGIITDQKISNH
jgi:hypothetical protein